MVKVVNQMMKVKRISLLFGMQYSVDFLNRQEPTIQTPKIVAIIPVAAWMGDKTPIGLAGF